MCFVFSEVIVPDKVNSDVLEPTQINRREANVSRMAREFLQAVAEIDAQPCQGPENCHSLVPGMSQYGESQEFSDDVGIVVANPGILSFSTSAANSTELPLFSNGSQGSNSHFQLATR